MATNYLAPGDVLDVLIPGGCSSGDTIVVNSLVGVAQNAAASAATISVAVTGVHRITKTAGSGIKFSQGTKVYISSGSATNASTGNTAAGIAVANAASDATTVDVRLTPGMVGP